LEENIETGKTKAEDDGNKFVLRGGSRTQSPGVEESSDGKTEKASQK